MSLASNLLQHIRDNPGVTGAELRNHFSEESKFSVSAYLGRLSKQGLSRIKDRRVLVGQSGIPLNSRK